MKGHVRTCKIALEHKIGMEIPETHPLLSWLVYYACQAYNRYHLGPDGRSPRERVLGRRVPGPVACFSESIYWQPLSPDHKPPALDLRYYEGHFMGYDESSNTYVVLTSQGAIRCRSIRRRPVSERWGNGIFDVEAGRLWRYTFRSGRVQRPCNIRTKTCSPAKTQCATAQLYLCNTLQMYR